MSTHSCTRTDKPATQDPKPTPSFPDLPSTPLFVTRLEDLLLFGTLGVPRSERLPLENSRRPSGVMFPKLETSYLKENSRDREHMPKVGITEQGVSLVLMTPLDRPDSPRPCAHGDVPTRRGQTSETNYNRLGHTVCRGNQHQPYPLMASVIAWMELNNHCNERFPDLYIMDKVWAVKRIWKERIKSVKLSPFQEAMLESGLREFHESQDQILGCADVPIGFASAMTGECFEAIRELTDEMIHNDLLVRRLSV